MRTIFRLSSKRETHKDRLLVLLGDGQPHHMRELLRAGGFRYGGRLHELRADGYIIDTVRIGEGEYTYRLVVENRQGVLI